MLDKLLTVRISIEEDQKGEPEYILNIYNEEGKLIENISPKSLAAFLLIGVHAEIPDRLRKDLRNPYLEPSYITPSKLMEDLYEEARRVAMGTDRAIDSILDSPEKKDKVPF